MNSVNCTVTAKLKLSLSPEQEILLKETILAYRSGCNRVANYIYSAKSLNGKQVHDALYGTLRTEFGLRSQMAESVIKTVIASYKTIEKNQGQWICPVYRQPSCDLVWNRDYSLLKDKETGLRIFSVNTLEGRIKAPFKTRGMEHYLDGSWRFGTAKLVTRKGNWFLHIPVSREVPVCELQESAEVVGIDLGINFLMTAYDSTGKTQFVNGREIKQKRAQKAKIRKDLQARQTPSARRRLKAIGSRENRWMQDVNHCITKALVEKHPKSALFVLEDLTGIRKVTENVRLKDRYTTVSWAFFDFRKKLEYKASLTGSIVIAVEPAYTSQQCPVCGYIHKGNRDKKNHIFRCRTCGYRSNDDRIGAMNLYQRGIKYLDTVVV